MGEIRRLLTENDELRDKIQELLAENARLKAERHDRNEERKRSGTLWVDGGGIVYFLHRARAATGELSMYQLTRLENGEEG